MSRGIQRPRLDSNHVAMVEALRGIGAFVQSLATVGCGCPDMLVGYRGKWMLIEAKDGENIPSKRVLTDYEKRWHHSAKACGAVIIIAESPEQAVVQVITEGAKQGIRADGADHETGLHQALAVN